MSSQHTHTAVSGESSTGPPLVATLAIEPEQEMECPLFEGTEEVDSLEQNLTFESDCSENSCQGTHDHGTCNTAMAADGNEGESQFMRAAITPGCFCLQFHQVDCIPTFERTNRQKVIVTVQIPDRETLRDLISRLRATGSTVSVNSITQSAPDSGGSIRIDTSEITEKQLEALEVAVETGYYDSPRQADLEVLADRLDVSKSAISQRLKAVESRLARKLVGQLSGQ
ncbi:helix-turn-helix domain-containing protein [Halodesulfurarchaeum formicicum]|uniref:Bacterio-opsin activator HTH domain-containing protein n=1 Tax=Halodesulfurarchaeum formicicum TaxID=1873524 RepID=A0A1J1AE84_9EURY|nr:helix-turn-helix domain-containing protein [Halodesulfurarchaeum formicicum]APE96056.1 bacterio-opsin activator HTH domain-containing protein [Halodesulfurarchaeum formicicum]